MRDIDIRQNECSRGTALAHLSSFWKLCDSLLCADILTIINLPPQSKSSELRIEK